MWLYRYDWNQCPSITAMQINLDLATLLEKNNQLSMRYIDNNGSITEKFPYNPNGSFKGITSVSSKSGNVLIVRRKRTKKFCQQML